VDAKGGIVQQCSKINNYVLLGWLGLRIWQAYDLWYFAGHRNNNVYAMPTADGFMIGYQF
jgi:hypothetical protein